MLQVLNATNCQSIHSGPLLLFVKDPGQDTYSNTKKRCVDLISQIYGKIDNIEQ